MCHSLLVWHDKRRMQHEQLRHGCEYCIRYWCDIRTTSTCVILTLISFQPSNLPTLQRWNAHIKKERKEIECEPSNTLKLFLKDLAIPIAVKFSSIILLNDNIVQIALPHYSYRFLFIPLFFTCFIVYF